MILTWLLAAVLALPLPAAQLQAPPVEVHPLLLGPLSDAASPVAKELTAQADRLTSLQADRPMTPVEFSKFLAPLFSGSAVQRPAAAILAKVVADPSAASAVFKVAPNLKASGLAELSGAALAAPAASDEKQRSALQDLALASTKDPYAKLVFDGFSPPNGLDGLEMTAAGPVPKAGGELKQLGAGTFGVVHEHPSVAGAIIKTIFYPKDWGVEGRRKMYEFAYQDELSARPVARAGAGPRVLSHTDQLGSPILIKERVYGDNLHALIKSGRYTAREHRLVLELIDRLAEGRIAPDDLREPNIMIGRTLLDPELRAYLIDGGELLQPGTGIKKRALAERLYTQPARWVSKGSSGAQVLKSKPLNQILEEALVASKSASWWTRLKVAWRRRRALDRETVEPY